MVPIIDREGLRKRVVKWQLVLREEADRIVVDVLVRVVRFVLSHEAVVGAREIRASWVRPIGFTMARRPPMVEARTGADAPIVTGEYLLAFQVQVVGRA